MNTSKGGGQTMMKGRKLYTVMYSPAINRILVSHQVPRTLARPAILCHAGSYMTVYVQSLTFLPVDVACRTALPNELSTGL